jgi:4-amino-4-deoxy-L-arabinose transferase-like glycosyltransferase
MDSLPVKNRDNYFFLILLSMGAVLIFAYSWVPGGLDVDSCNYAAVAKEALRTDKWLGLYDPVYQGVFYYHFPLCIWMTALFFKILGVSTFTAKLFSMISSLFLVGVIFYFGKILKNKWVGFFAGASFLFTNHIVRLSRQCRMDLPVTLFITLAILAFILSQRRSRAYYILFGLFTGLAVLSKDIFGVFPLAIVSLYLLLRLRIKEFFHPLFIAGLLTAAAPVLLWIRLDNGALFMPWFNWNFLHLLSSTGFNVPWYYYIQSLVNKYFYFLPLALYGGYLAVREARVNKNSEFYLLIIWAVIFPLAFSFGRQKLHYFILPIYPAASLLVGLACDRIFKERAKERAAAGIKYILIIAGIAMLCLPMNIRSKRFDEIVRIAPAMDKLLQQLPGYEFISYKEDVASILCYSQELSLVKYIDEKSSLEEKLISPYHKARVCYMRESEFTGLDPAARSASRVLLRYKDRVVIVSPEGTDLTVTLP